MINLVFYACLCIELEINGDASTFFLYPSMVPGLLLRRVRVKARGLYDFEERPEGAADSTQLQRE